MARVTISSNNLFPGPRGAQGLKGDTGNKGDKGDTGEPGTNGTNGAGVVVGGTTGQALTKIDSTDYNTQWTTIPLLDTANTFTGGVQQINAAASTVGLIVRLNATGTSDLQQWQSSAGVTVASVRYFGAINAGAVIGSTQLSSNATNASTIGMIVRGAASQTANLQEWQNSAGTVFARINSAGHILGSTRSAFGSVTGIISGVNVAIISGESGVVPLMLRGASTGTANLQEWQTNAGTIVAYVTDAGVIRSNIFSSVTTGVTTLRFNFQNSGAGIQTGAAAQKGLILRGSASQTANLLEVQDSTPTTLTAITPAGTINFASGNTSATATAGSVSLPLMAVGFITMQVAGTTVKVPYYAN